MTTIKAITVLLLTMSAPSGALERSSHERPTQRPESTIPLESRSDCVQRCANDYSRCVNQGCQGSDNHGACMQECFSKKQACERTCG